MPHIVIVYISYIIYHHIYIDPSGHRGFTEHASPMTCVVCYRALFLQESTRCCDSDSDSVHLKTLEILEIVSLARVTTKTAARPKVIRNLLQLTSSSSKIDSVELFSTAGANCRTHDYH